MAYLRQFMAPILQTTRAAQSLNWQHHLHRLLPSHSRASYGGFSQSKSFTHCVTHIPIKFFLRSSGVQSPVIALTLPTNDDSDTWNLTKEKSKHKVLKKHHTKSSPNIKSLTLRTLVPEKANTRVFDDLPHLPTPDSTRSSFGDVPLYLADNWEPQSPGSAIYFTVDPSWDPSKGDADVYLLPFPDATTVTESPVLRSIAEGSAPRLRTSTHANKAPRNLKSVVKTDNETSFLFFK
jgi:hypothetical protein